MSMNKKTANIIFAILPAVPTFIFLINHRTKIPLITAIAIYATLLIVMVAKDRFVKRPEQNVPLIACFGWALYTLVPLNVNPGPGIKEIPSRFGSIISRCMEYKLEIIIGFLAVLAICLVADKQKHIWMTYIKYGCVGYLIFVIVAAIGNIGSVKTLLTFPTWPLFILVICATREIGAEIKGNPAPCLKWTFILTGICIVVWLIYGANECLAVPNILIQGKRWMFAAAIAAIVGTVLFNVDEDLQVDEVLKVEPQFWMAPMYWSWAIYMVICHIFASTLNNLMVIISVPILYVVYILAHLKWKGTPGWFDEEDSLLVLPILYWIVAIPVMLTMGKIMNLNHKYYLLVIALVFVGYICSLINAKTKKKYQILPPFFCIAGLLLIAGQQGLLTPGDGFSVRILALLCTSVFLCVLYGVYHKVSITTKNGREKEFHFSQPILHYLPAVMCGLPIIYWIGS